MKCCTALFAALVVAVSVTTAQAQLYWDSNGATAGAGTNAVTLAGTWGTSPFWHTNSAGTPGLPGAWTAGQTAVFSAGTDATVTYTVTVSGTQSAADVTFEEGTVTLSGGTLDLTGGTINTATGRTATIASIVDGAVVVTKTGTGTLVLSGANAYDNGTSISAGALQFVNTNSMPIAGNVSLSSVATLSVNAGGAGQWGAGASGVGTIGGLITDGSGGQVGSPANQVAWVSGSTLGIDTTNAGGTFTYSNVIGSFYTGGTAINDVGLTKLGTGTLALTAGSTYTGATRISAGTLQLGDGGTAGTLSTSSAITNNATFAVNRSDAVTQGVHFHSGPIAGTGGVTQAGSGTLTLNAENTFSGNTLATAGTLLLTHSLALKNSLLDMGGAGAVVFDNSLTAVTLRGLTGSGNYSANSAMNLTVGNSGNSLVGPYSGVISGTGSLTKIGTGTQILSGANTYSGGTNVNVGTLQFANPTAMPIGSAAGGDYNGDGKRDAADYVVWRKDPASFGNQAGYDTWSANFGVIGGAANSVNVNSSATLAVNAGGAGEWATATSGGGSIGGLIAGVGGQGTVDQITWANDSRLGIDTTNATSPVAYSGVIGSFRAASGTTNAVGLTKRGVGTLELTGANTYTGPTTLTAVTAPGTANILKAVATNTLPSATVLAMPAGNGNAQVQLYAGSTPSSGDKFDQTVAGITGGGTGTAGPTIVDVGYATLTIDVPSGQSPVYDGYLNTAFDDPTIRGKVIKTGAGDLTLSGANNTNTAALGFGGEFSMEAGRLIYVNNVGTGGAGNLRPSQLTLKGGTLVKAFVNATTGLPAPETSMSLVPRTLEIAGSFTMDMNGSTANAQIIPPVASGGLGGINLTASNPTITVFGEVANTNVSTALPFTPAFILGGTAVIADGAATNGLTKAGTGTLSFNTVNTYNGTTTIAEGILRLSPQATGPFAGLAPTLGFTDGPGGLADAPVVLSGGSLAYSGGPIGGTKVLTINNPVTMTASSGIGHTTGSGAGGLSATGNGQNVDVIFSDFTASAGTLTLFNAGSSNEPNIGSPHTGFLDVRVGFSAGNSFDFAQPIVVQNHTNVLVSANRKTYLMSTNTTGDHTFSGVISGNGGYVRNGAGGTSYLTANNTYTGDTKVLAGTLSIENPYLADTADVYLTTGSFLDLNFSTLNETDTIDQLFIDGAAAATGTWGALLSGADNETSLITGGGWLLVTAMGAGGGGAVPEPGTLALAMMAVFAVSAIRRRHG